MKTELNLRPAYLRRGHVDVEDAADEQPDGGGESRVGLHDLRRLLLDDEGAGDEVAEELGELGEEL